MTEQRKKIETAVEFIRHEVPDNFKPKLAVITDSNVPLPKGLKILTKIHLSDIHGCGDFIAGKYEGKDIIIIKGRLHFYEGFSMREIAHYIYVIKYLGVKTIISIDEAGHLNPRFSCGEAALIYDHINLTGDNPLIGENDDELGLRFPDMSNAYDKKTFNKVYKLLQKKEVKINESVYIGLIGPETETEAEARFYREIGGDICGYSIVPENITAVHANINFIGIGLITRELIADKMMECTLTEKELEKNKEKSLKESLKTLNLFYSDLIKIFT